MELRFALTHDQIHSVRTRLHSAGVPLTQDKGTIQAKGITAEYEYNPATCYLTLRITKRPVLLPEGLVRAKVEEFLGRRAEP